MSASRVRSVCPYCGVGCGIVMEVKDNRVVKLSGDKQHPTNFGRLCTKGSTCAQALTGSGRLEHAYLRSDRRHEPARTPIDQAISQTAQRLRAIIDKHGPEAFAFYISGQMSLEAQYLANKLAKGFIGTPHVESNSRLCMASAGAGYKLSLGSDGPPGSYQDFDKADLFFVIGANMADCHPILFLRMMDRVKQGAKLIVVDPRRNTTADKSHLHLQIRPGTDLALLNGLLHLLVSNGKTDQRFIDEFTEGWDEMPGFLESYPPEKVAQITGLPEADIRKAAEWIGDAPNWMSCWTMGLNQSTHGTWHTNQMCNLHLATGAICKPGSGPFSLTGQPNAMGGREMGYMGPGLPGQRSLLSKQDRAFIEELWKVPRGTLRVSHSDGTVALFESMSSGAIKACWIVCTNPVATVPNRKNVIAGLEAAELVITQDAFHDTETNRYADILLPGALWSEAEGVMINSERNMTLMQKAVDPPGDALPDWQIIARVACEMGYREAFSYASSGEVFDELKRAWNPRTGYDVRGASHALLREMPLQWPYAPGAASDRNPIRYLNNGLNQLLRKAPDGSQPRLSFATESGRALFLPRPHLPPAEMPDPDFPFVLNTGRLQHQWHTLTKTGKIATLNKLNPGPFLEIHPEDAARLGIVDKDRVEVRSRRGLAMLPAVVTDRVRPGNCFAPFHWNDVYGKDLTINAVTNDAVDPISHQPEFKYCAVVLTKVAQQAETLSKVADPAAIEKRPEPLAAGAKEFDMDRIDSLAKLLGMDAAPSLTLKPDEQLYLHGYLMGLRAAEAPQSLSAVPTLPPSAPLEAKTRLVVDGMLSGLFARSRIEEDQQPTAATARAAPSAVASKSALTILWASQTGKMEEFAALCAKRLEATGHPVTLASMGAFPVADLGKVSHLLVMTSTFGDGDPPDNGAAFWTALQAQGAPALASLRFAVLAFGDSNYDQFCGFGKKLDARLEALGGQRLLPRVDCEPDYEEQAGAWLDSTVSNLSGADAPAPAAVPAPAPAAKAAFSRSQPLLSRLKINRRLNADGSEKDTRLFAFELGASGLGYEAGDALGVWPTNCPGLVAELLAALQLPAADEVVLKDGTIHSLEEALLRQFEICRITPEVLKLVAERNSSPDLVALLAPERKRELQNWLWARQITDLLHEFPIRVSAGEWIDVLKRMQPRSYSIASSPKAHPDSIHLTVSVVRYACGERARQGVCSSFLADRAEGAEIPIFVQKSAHFRPPKQSDTPMIMVGPGTGVAPFRAFLQDRQADGAKGRNWLLFGEQRASHDFYYRDELEAMQRAGSLHRLDTAFSRDQSEKVYVQHRMLQAGADLWSWLQDGAHFYVCGDATRMAKDVDAALKQIVQTHGAMSPEDAVGYVSKLSHDKRYVRDVY